MNKEDKSLLVKDLCARLPYNVMCQVEFKEDGKYNSKVMLLSGIFTDEAYFTTESGSIYSNEYKPYLFPLSSMTEEMIEEFNNLFNGSFQYFNQGVISASRIWDRNEAVFVGELECSKLIDWFNAHHIDYRCLIEKGLAIDATGKNIYMDLPDTYE